MGQSALPERSGGLRAASDMADPILMRPRWLRLCCDRGNYSEGAVNDPLASVLDFLVMDDRWVIGFCDAAQLSYETPMQARAALPGGQLPHWT